MTVALPVVRLLAVVVALLASSVARGVEPRSGHGVCCGGDMHPRGPLRPRLRARVRVVGTEVRAVAPHDPREGWFEIWQVYEVLSTSRGRVEGSHARLQVGPSGGDLRGDPICRRLPEAAPVGTMGLLVQDWDSLDPEFLPLRAPRGGAPWGWRPSARRPRFSRERVPRAEQVAWPGSRELDPTLPARLDTAALDRAVLWRGTLQGSAALLWVADEVVVAVDLPGVAVALTEDERATVALIEPVSGDPQASRGLDMWTVVPFELRLASRPFPEGTELRAADGRVFARVTGRDAWLLLLLGDQAHEAPPPGSTVAVIVPGVGNRGWIGELVVPDGAPHPGLARSN